jgi:acetylcholinesterase
MLSRLLLASVGLAATVHARAGPSVDVQNGTLVGIHSPEYDQDYFLGIPFAQPPVGQLRFANPQPLNESWGTPRDASNYSPACVGYGSSQMGYDVSEDCLYLNVIRPSGYQDQQLPVLVWIFGGGWVQGSGVDRRYNMSFIVEHSVKIGHPIIAVTMNYRLSAWGFLSSDELFETGHSNFGLRDQRTSLSWVQENIAAFGGNPSRVTLFGQSAGAFSIGQHITAYGGRDDGLFAAAVMLSGSPLAGTGLPSSSQSQYKRLLGNTGCNTSTSSIECLRGLPYEQLNAVINTTLLSSGWRTRIDGDIIADYASNQLNNGRFIKVPILVGATTDEGTNVGSRGLNTNEEFIQRIQNDRLNSSWAEAIAKAYPLISPDNILPNQAEDWVPPSEYGLQYRRAATYAGDQTFIAPRRFTCETWAKHNLTAYCYRFNSIPSWSSYLEGSTHFADVAFAQLNLLGVGYPPVRTPPFQGLDESYQDLARLFSGDIIAFAATGDPNSWSGRKVVMQNTLGDEVPRWPRYSSNKSCGEPKLFVYEGNITSYVEDDVWRREGIAKILSGNLEVYDR